jgi:hypothetical protein
MHVSWPWCVKLGIAQTDGTYWPDSKLAGIQAVGNKSDFFKTVPVYM